MIKGRGGKKRFNQAINLPLAARNRGRNCATARRGVVGGAGEEDESAVLT